MRVSVCVCVGAVSIVVRVLSEHTPNYHPLFLDSLHAHHSLTMRFPYLFFGWHHSRKNILQSPNQLFNEGNRCSLPFLEQICSKSASLIQELDNGKDGEGKHKEDKNNIETEQSQTHSKTRGAIVCGVPVPF